MKSLGEMGALGLSQEIVGNQKSWAVFDTIPRGSLPIDDDSKLI
jgi:hypothetical protein